MAGCFTLSDLRAELMALGHDNIPDHVILSFVSTLEANSTRCASTTAVPSPSSCSISSSADQGCRPSTLHGPPVPGDRDYQSRSSSCRYRPGLGSLCFSPEFAVELEEIRKALGLMGDTYDDLINRSLSRSSSRRTMVLEDEHERYLGKLFKEWRVICRALPTNQRFTQTTMSNSITQSAQELREEQTSSPSHGDHASGSGSSVTSTQGTASTSPLLEQKLEVQLPTDVGSTQVVQVRSEEHLVERDAVPSSIQVQRFQSEHPCSRSRKTEDDTNVRGPWVNIEESTVSRKSDVYIPESGKENVQTSVSVADTCAPSESPVATGDDFLTIDQQFDEVKIYTPISSKSAAERFVPPKVKSMEPLSNEQFLAAFEKRLEGVETPSTLIDQEIFSCVHKQISELTFPQFSSTLSTRPATRENSTCVSQSTIESARKPANQQSPLIDRSNFPIVSASMFDPRMCAEDVTHVCAKAKFTDCLSPDDRNNSQSRKHRKIDNPERSRVQDLDRLEDCESAMTALHLFEDSPVKNCSDRVLRYSSSEKSISPLPNSNILLDNPRLVLSPLKIGGNDLSGGSKGLSEERRGSCTVCPPAFLRKSNGNSPFTKIECSSSVSESSPDSVTMRPASGIFTPLLPRNKKTVTGGPSSVVFKTSRLSTSVDLSEGDRPKRKNQSFTRSSTDNHRSSGLQSSFDSQESRSSSETAKRASKGTLQSRSGSFKEKGSVGGSHRGGKIDRVARFAEMQDLWKKDDFLRSCAKRKPESFHRMFADLHASQEKLYAASRERVFSQWIKFADYMRQQKTLFYDYAFVSSEGSTSFNERKLEGFEELFIKYSVVVPSFQDVSPSVLPTHLTTSANINSPRF